MLRFTHLSFNQSPLCCLLISASFFAFMPEKICAIVELVRLKSPFTFLGLYSRLLLFESELLILLSNKLGLLSQGFSSTIDNKSYQFIDKSIFIIP